jgi:hypothetical protein
MFGWIPAPPLARSGARMTEEIAAFVGLTRNDGFEMVNST